MRRSLSLAVGLSLLLGFCSGPVRADVVGTVDENGHGTSVNTSNNQMGTFPGTNGVDPFDPTNGLRPLIYDIGTVPGMVVGDILLPEVVGNATLSDLVRFTTNPLNGHDLLILYSDVEPNAEKDLADVGIPVSLQTNLLTFAEAPGPNGLNGLFGYFPTPNQPGFLPLPPGFGRVVYNIISDAAPEPSSIVLLGSGLGLILVYRKGRRLNPVI
ncbi:MAG TPA: PEP-CTERM sorting domain-containing protein [Isosphaeraceae bacterium]|jgi:hypothetical protein|nr:PEP-CTERM sorting domain-containing protein [Isosphaeraceae bacterium]